MLRYPTVKAAVGFRSKDNVKEVKNGTLMTYKVLKRDVPVEPPAAASGSGDESKARASASWASHRSLLKSMGKGETGANQTGPFEVRYGLLRLAEDGYAALVATLGTGGLSGAKTRVVVAQRFGARPWQKVGTSLRPDWDNARQRASLEAIGWPSGTRHPLVKRALSRGDAQPASGGLLQVTRSRVVHLVESCSVECPYTRSQIRRILRGEPGVDDCVEGAAGECLRSVPVPKHLEELCGFLLVCPQYFRLFACFRRVYTLLLRKSESGDLSAEADGFAVATTLLKIVEDGYVQWVFLHGNTRILLEGTRFVPAGKLEEVAGDVFALLDLVHDAVASKIPTVSDATDELERDSFNIHALCLHWLACRMLDDLNGVGRGRREESHLLNLLKLEARLLHKSGVSLLHHEEKVSLVEDLLLVPDSACTSAHIDSAPKSKRLWSFSGPTLFGSALKELCPGDLISFGEAAVLYDADGFPLHALLSCLTFMHETRGLPLSYMRHIAYISALARDFLPSSEEDCPLPDRDPFPEGIFLGNDPVTGKTRRPVTRWWLRFAHEVAHTRLQGHLLVSFFFSYPQYARMRVAAFWDPTTESFSPERYSRYAKWEVQTLIEFLRKGFMHARDLVREAKSRLECGRANSLMACHASFASGGPFAEWTPSIVSRCRTNARVISFLKQCPVEPCARSEERWSFDSEYPKLQLELDLLKDGASEGRFLDTDEWTELANVALLFREVHLDGYPRGLFSFSVASGHGFKQWCFLLKWLAGKKPTKVKIRHRPLHRHAFHRPANELTYHLHRHDVRPVAGHVQRRKFFRAKPREVLSDFYFQEEDKSCSALDHLFTPDAVDMAR